MGYSHLAGVLLCTSLISVTCAVFDLQSYWLEAWAKLCDLRQRQKDSCKFRVIAWTFSLSVVVSLMMVVYLSYKAYLM